MSRVRWYLALLGLAAAPAAFVAGACGGGSPPAECGAGMQLVDGTCVPVHTDGGSEAGQPEAGQPEGGQPDAGPDAAPDAGPDASPDAGPDASPDAGPDAAPQDPSFIFGGVTSVSPASTAAVDKTVSLFVTWEAAEDPFTLPAQMKYSVYVATTSKGEAFGAAPAAQVQGTTSTTIAGLSVGKTYYVVVRATNVGGVQDDNVHELSAVATTDTTDPVLSTAPTVVPRLACQSRVSWAPATDGATSAAGMRYNVYLADTMTDLTGAPLMTTAPGVTTVDIAMPSATTAYHSFVVVAEDAAGNLSFPSPTQAPVGSVDTNAIGFEASVQPILSGGCVPSCHTVNTTNKLTPVYDDGYAYDDILGTASAPTLAHVCVPKASPASTSCAPDTAIAGCADWLTELDGGIPVTAQLVTPNDPSCSVIYQVAAQQRMPPKSANLPPLSACDLQVLHDWIQGGAQP